MMKCDICNKQRAVMIKLEFFNSNIDEKPQVKNLCLFCLDKKKYKIDIREYFQLMYEDLVDFPEDYFEDK